MVFIDLVAHFMSLSRYFTPSFSSQTNGTHFDPLFIFMIVLTFRNLKYLNILFFIFHCCLKQLKMGGIANIPITRSRMSVKMHLKGPVKFPQEANIPALDKKKGWGWADFPAALRLHL